MYIDTHCHLNLKDFESDWREVVEKAKKAGVSKMIVVGADLSSSKRAIEMAEEVEGLYAVVGFHPHHCKGLDDVDEMMASIEKLTKNKKVVAIGECGLDYHVYQKSKYEKTQVTEDQKKLQKRVFGRQIQLASKLNLPLVIHNREAQRDILDTIDHFCKRDGKYPKGVFHCISGSKKFVKQLIERGFYVGVDGNVTYSSEVQALVDEIPLERLLLETDSPWLTPEPLRSQQKVPNRLSLKLQTADGLEPKLRNTPISVRIVAEYLSQAKNVSLEKIRASTTKNAEALFNI